MKYVRTREHNYGTHRPKFQKVGVGARVMVAIGPREKEVEAEVCGPIQKDELRDARSKMVYVWSVLVRVKGEKKLREIDPERIRSVLP